MHHCFKSIIGQTKTKTRLSFHLAAFKEGASLPFYLFIGAKGCGKNQIAKSLAKGIKECDHDYAAHLINCATIKNLASFKQHVYDTYIEGRKTILLFDECHNLPDIVQQVLLSAFDVSKEVERRVFTEDGEMVFNTRNNLFILMTSEPDKLFGPLKDRLEPIAMAPYTSDELAQVVILQNKKIKVAPEILPDISSHLRGNPRSAVKLSQSIEKYCLINKSEIFGEKEWQAFKQIEGLCPHGLDGVEIQILRTLKDRGECSLNDLRAVTGLSRSALMNNHEVFLMHKGFLCVKQKRQLTQKGREVLKQIDELGI